MSQLYFQPPVFITGVPRSGTSMVAGIFSLCGAWLGMCAGIHNDNPLGFFENLTLRNGINKTILSMLCVDYRGMNSLPPRKVDFDISLRGVVYDAISAEGCPREATWAFKDVKLALLWRPWARSFSEATWIVTDRNEEDSAKSCAAAFFRLSADRDYAGWLEFVRQFRDRIEDLEENVEHIYRVNTDEIIDGDLLTAREAVEGVGLEWNERAVEEFIDRSYWKRWDMEKAS